MRWIEEDLRHLMALAAGAVVAFALFLLMHAFIAMHPPVTSASTPAIPVGWTAVQHKMTVHTKTHLLTPPRLARHPPPTGLTPQTPVNPIPRQRLPLNPRSVGPPGTGPVVNPGPQNGPSASGGQPLGVVSRIPPLYPPQAAYRNVTGTVTTCFTVRSDGSVANARVVGASSAQARHVLGQAALVSILQWKFVPRMVNGHSVATNNVCQDIAFTLDH